MSRHQHVPIMVDIWRQEDGRWSAVFGFINIPGGGVVGNITHKSNVVRECIHTAAQAADVPRSRIRIKEVKYS